MTADDLVQDILDVFAIPECVPMTDQQRIDVIRHWHGMALKISESKAKTESNQASDLDEHTCPPSPL